VRNTSADRSGSSHHRPGAETWPEAEPEPCEGHGIWRVELTLDDGRRARCLSVLDGSERIRAERFLRREDRDRFLASHAALRVVLGAVLGIEPAAVAFAVSPTGRPSLVGQHAGRLDFNLSHSGTHALVALSTTARIGVDIEVHRPIPDLLRIARAHFHPREIAALEEAGPDREAAFFAAWTAKEAFVKAIGVGLSMPLDAFAVAIPPAPAELLEAAGALASAWTLIGLAPVPGATGAVAIDAPRARCRRARLPADWADRFSI